VPLSRRRALLLAATCAGAGPPGAARAQADQFFDSAGVRIHYVEAGQGEPVILLHGYTDNLRNNWIATSVLPTLAKRYRVVALDARGHGDSGKPHDRAAYGPEMGMDIVRLMDRLGIRRAHIVGYSMGC